MNALQVLNSLTFGCLCYEMLQMQAQITTKKPKTMHDSTMPLLQARQLLLHLPDWPCGPARSDLPTSRAQNIQHEVQELQA